MTQQPPIDFPAADNGRRSSADFGRQVVADALRAVDPAAASAAERETDWRRGYLRHFRALVTAGLDGGGDAAYRIAEAGLASVRRRIPLTDVFRADRKPLETTTITGSAKPETEVVLPFRKDLLSGDALRKQLDTWVAAGSIEESCAAAVREVAANPDWLDLADLRPVVLGAAAEMGPLPALLGWGATVVGVDLPRPDLQKRIVASAEQGAGRLLMPKGGADLLTKSDLGAVAHWLEGLDGRLVLGTYVYAPGGVHTRLSVAVDALTTYLESRRPDLALAFLATPTDVFAVPPEAVAQATRRFHERGRRARLTATLSAGRLLQPNYPDGGASQDGSKSAGKDSGINDSLVPQQGPNYALAKRIQRWRATAARQERTVSLSVAPPTHTRSVTNNRLLAAAYAGAHLFDVEVFEPATANKLMAILLVHQLRKPRPAAAQAWRDEAFAAAHGGLWRTAYRPRTALGLAAVRGLLLPR